MPAAPQVIPEPLSVVQYYNIIRGQVENEDNLMMQRLNWFITSQSFLFSAYAIDVTSLFSSPPLATSDVYDTRQLLRILIPLVAIITSAVILVTICAGVLAMHNLRGLFQKHVRECDCSELPPVHGFRQTWALGLVAPLVLPVVFLAVWTFLLVHNPHVKHVHADSTTQHTTASSAARGSAGQRLS